MAALMRRYEGVAGFKTIDERYDIYRGRQRSDTRDKNLKDVVATLLLRYYESVLMWKIDNIGRRTKKDTKADWLV